MEVYPKKKASIEALKELSRKNKNAASGNNSESGAAGQGAGEAKRHLYHCNYCNFDITGKIRIKCVVCSDFDLCVECFSVGAELTPHKSNHAYRVMDNLSFPLICPDWNADEEILLLEGLEMYGMNNWAEVAEHVGTKNKEACTEHYRIVYLDSPCFPLPDMSHVVGKSREELLAMGKEQADNKKGSDSGLSVKAHAAARTNQKASSRGREKDSSRNSGGNKPKSSRNDSPSLVEASGYNPKRQEFDIEYDNDAEKLLADMEFNDSDTADEIEIKLRMIRIYNRRLDERERRKKFILERNLLYPNPFEKDLTPEEKAICRQYDVFMHFHTKEAHEELLTTVISEHRLKKKIQELKEARAAGKRRRTEAEESALRARESAYVVPRNRGVPNALMSPDSADPRPAGRATSSSVNEMDATGANLLSEAEKRLCCELGLPPTVYLKMQEDLSIQMIAGNVSSKSDAHRMFQMDTMKVDMVYDMLIKKGFGSP
ncbi:putative transcription factor MYB/SANT family [Medicago truncatula]|uniref:Transcriptional adapter n=1 Tax=Medicago truncatula TaxID=3880 RepID=A0A072U0P5_MEDTR|nr:transcriptional adapter ADA2a [Medicago truncatula]RHN46187.1 putative transcription factor MYB/SANT family [Medicago truncatula]